MKKYLLSICLLASLSACTDDIKDDVVNLMRIQPNGLVLLEDESFVQNSNYCVIPFRVNPSHYPLRSEDISLDVFSADFQRSFTTTSVDEYQLDSVVQVKDEAGNVKEGEWKAVIHVKDGKYYSKARIALVLKYQDVQGKDRMLTSSTLSRLETVPVLTEDMITINNYPSLSAWTHTGNITTHEFSCLPAPISPGSSVLYKMEGTKIDSVRVAGDNADMFDLEQLEDFKFKITPNGHFSIPDSTRYVDVDLLYYFQDLYCNNLDKEPVLKKKNLKFYKSKVSPELRILTPKDIVPKDSVNHIPAHISIPLEDVFAQCGITDDAIEERAYGIACPTMKFIDNEGRIVALPCIAKMISDDDSVKPSKLNVLLRFYTDLKDKDFGKEFNLKAVFVYSDIRNGQQRFYCDLTYPMRFEKE